MIFRDPQAREVVEDISQLCVEEPSRASYPAFFGEPRRVNGDAAPSLAKSKRLPLGKSGLLIMIIALD
jgi:hypothetical protein